MGHIIRISILIYFIFPFSVALSLSECEGSPAQEELSIKNKEYF